MSDYVMSDIHGCYREFMQLLKKVDFKDDEDKLYILGDIIDRGPGSEEMFEWVYSRYNKNVFMCMGNHEDMFCDFVDYLEASDLAEEIMKKEGVPDIDKGFIDNSDLSPEYKEKLTFYVDFINDGRFYSYDKYGTLKQLLTNGNDKSFLFKMRDFFRQLPYYFYLEKNGKKIYLVHAYISEPPERCDKFNMIWSREYPSGKPGIPGKIVIFGHTPTVGSKYDMQGGIYIDRQNGAITINIDCGCCWRAPNSKLAIVDLDTLRYYYSDLANDGYSPDTDN